MEPENPANPGLSFEVILQKYPWKEIPNCPGRYVVTGKTVAIDKLTPLEVLGIADLKIHDFPETTVKDPIKVIVFPVDKGGLLSYCKAENRYVHTLNSPSGLLRKLSAIGVDPAFVLEEQ